MKQTIEKSSDDNDDVKKRRKYSRRNKMFVICRELCFILIVAFSAYATILNSQPKTRKGAPSLPFLKNSNVDDFYQGDLSQLMHEVGSATFSFVFFYAPWDADSQDLKNEFLETAEFYSPQVYFAGVNCWEPGSECRTRFKDVVDRYPQLVAYVGLERAVEYKGPHKADYMIKFLHSVIHPISRLDSITDLWKMRYLHDAVLVGFLQIRGTFDLGLGALYETSLSLASRDFLRRTSVAVFTHSRFNLIMGVNATPTIHLYIGNKQLHYNGTLKRGPLLKWVVESLKGNLISTDGLLLLKPPTVVMFTPLHPLALLNPSYLMLRRVAMSVLNDSGDTEQDFFSYIIKHNTAFQTAYYQEIVQEDTETRDLCSRLMLGTQTCTIRPKWDNHTCRIQSRIDFFNGDEQEMIILHHRKEQCKILDRAPRPPPSISPPSPALNLNTTFGFACLDSKLFAHLAEAIGINLLSEAEETVIVVIGEEEIIKVPIPNEETLWSVLQDWTHGKRERTVSNYKVNSPPSPQKERVYLQELNLHSFNQLLHQSQQHALILYHSRYCGACARASHYLLEIEHLLKDVKCIRISRIDGDKVDLPWHYSLHFFPSLLFLPAIRKSESRLFPADAAWNFSSLSNFILSNLNVEERPEVMLALCARWGQYPEISLEGSECIREARKVSLDGIEIKLKEIRRLRDRKSLLIHLDFLKTVHLALARVTDIFKSLSFIRSLSNDYHIGCSVT